MRPLLILFLCASAFAQLPKPIAAVGGGGAGGATIAATSAPIKGDGAGNGLAAAGSDIVGLWASGKCSGYLKSDGTCADTGTSAGTLALGNHTHNMALEGALYDIGTCTTAATIDPANGRNQKVLLTAADACVITITQPASGTAAVSVRVTQAATPTGTLTWPACVLGTSGSCWPGGIVPVMTASASARDWYTCKLDGANAFCTAGQDFK